jgi:hypothetical protein
MTQTKSKKEEYIPIGDWQPELWDKMKVCFEQGDLRSTMIVLRQYITNNFVPKEEVKEIVEKAFYDQYIQPLSEQQRRTLKPLLQELLVKHNIK